MLLRVSEVSKALGFEESTVRKWVFLKKIPIVRVGRSVRIKQEDVDRLIADGYRPETHADACTQRK